MTPRPYQLEGRDFLAPRTRALLADSMRVGKTGQALLAAEKAGAKSVLVVCPAIAVPQWRKQAELWTPNLPTPLVMSFDMATRKRDELIALGPWDVLVPDEAHHLQNPLAQRTKLIFGKKSLGWHAGAIWPLTGTPATKSAAGLWPLLYAFGQTKHTYETWCRWACVYNANQQIIGTKEAVTPEIKAMLAKVMLRRTLKDVAPYLPPIQYNHLAVEASMPPECREQADTVRRLLAAVPEAERASALALAAESSAALRNMTAIAKAPALAQHILQGFREGMERTVAFAWHTEAIDVLARTLQAEGWPDLTVAILDGRTPQRQRIEIQADFLAGKIDVVVAQILAAGTAIDLSAARHCWFLELDWLPSSNVQAAHRLVNLEKADPVSCDVATWYGSVDEDVQAVLLRRTRELGGLL